MTVRITKTMSAAWLAAFWLGACGGGSSNSDEDSCNTCGQCEVDWEFLDCTDSCVCEQPDAETQQLKQNYLVLLECQQEEPCPTSYFNGDPYPGYWGEPECLLGALRDRTPGAYTFETNYGDQGSGSELRMLVSEDGTVLLAGSNHFRTLGGPLHRGYSPAQRCALQSADYFEACLESGTDVAANATTGGDAAAAEMAMNCRMPANWYTDCEALNPECPGSS